MRRSYYRTEKEITEQLYGVAHPLAVRSREDCIIILRDHLLGHEEVAYAFSIWKMYFTSLIKIIGLSFIAVFYQFN